MPAELPAMTSATRVESTVKMSVASLPCATALPSNEICTDRDGLTSTEVAEAFP